MRLLDPVFTARTFWLWFGGIWLAVGMLFLALGVYGTVQLGVEAQRFRAESQVTRGIVLTKSVGRGSAGVSHGVTYRFTTIDGQVITGAAQVSAASWDRMEELGPIEVTYLTRTPRSSRVDEQRVPVVLPITFTVLGSIFTSLGAFVFVKAIYQLRRTPASG